MDAIIAVDDFDTMAEKKQEQIINLFIFLLFINEYITFINIVVSINNDVPLSVVIKYNGFSRLVYNSAFNPFGYISIIIKLNIISNESTLLIISQKPL